jgi:capsular polysaccharide biosynthesis protein
LNRPPTDEIDLRAVVGALLRGKWRILLLTIVAGLLGLGISLLIPKKFEAVAQIAITQPVFSPDLAPVSELGPKPPNVSFVPNLPDIKALEDLALAEDLLQEVDESKSRSEMEVAFQVTVPSNTQLQLAVTDSSPDRAATLANRWAERLAQRLSRLYGISEADLANLQQAMAEVEAKRARSAEALVKQRPASHVDVLTVRFNEKTKTLANYINRLNGLEILTSDAETLGMRLARVPDTERLTPDAALALFSLQQRAVGGLHGVQLQADLSGLVGEQVTVAAARVTLGELMGALHKQRDALQETIAQTEEEVETLATQQESAKLEWSRLVEQRDVAYASYQALSRQIEEVRIFLAQNGATARIASRALPPTEPSSPRPVLYAVLAAMLGFLFSVAGVIAREWWCAPAQP